MHYDATQHSLFRKKLEFTDLIYVSLPLPCCGRRLEDAMQCNTVLTTIQCNTMQCNTIQCNAMQCSTNYYTMQYNAMQYYTMQCNAMQY
eukprot:TRINITY_DN76825_c0_g1_i1.p1 TRINITY_DN76825_c0_g1~~TRINITY_DN76825_c0_g1_i1.p1  ORF type:complete len:103 (-),score=4.32 TRINITY_DN76825_c0_g1_i1:119-385(-)